MVFYCLDHNCTSHECVMLLKTCKYYGAAVCCKIVQAFISYLLNDNCECNDNVLVHNSFVCLVSFLSCLSTNQFTGVK